ncbi:LuxR C-terminal-related transcriptional regulator [Streptomyces roseochromogenus]|uniref:HTH luxR-type domain-containing protein n=1 Tax=Streptomyces roseochromogenus subsp. oscitans DS 12.976 TaxID=1352936 RepID=V6K574_STRRC|nr:LuxR C-terminal-related transcriptional regulator [Streptomyces roseochromogenus]EST27272.1 hypothetical protein M878_25065 [Streptomyces roseochromogenus subsp. oscitans DS 12.976]
MARRTVTSEELSELVYRAALQDVNWTMESIALRAGIATPAVEEALDHLETAGLVRPSRNSPGGYDAVDPNIALMRLFSLEDQQLARHQEEVSRTRRAISIIMRDFLGVSSARRRTVELETLATAEGVIAFLDDAAAVARGRVWSMYGGAALSADAVDAMLLRDSAMAASGVALRLLFPRSHAKDQMFSGYLEELAGAGAEVRLAAHLPASMVVVDDDLALLSVDPEDEWAPALAVHGRDLVPTLQALYDHCWLTAERWDGHAAVQEPAAVGGETPLSPEERAIVQFLVEGMKDDAIARRLGVSTRTLSRMIASLLERLGVQTRFQAALELSRRGWLAVSGPALASV